VLLLPALLLNALFPEDDRLPYELPAEDCEVEGRARVDGREVVLPVEGRAPAFPGDGRVPGVPVEGRDPRFPVEGLAPAEPQPLASLVLALVPLCRIRF
jgi:hypothetical protein